MNAEEKKIKAFESAMNSALKKDKKDRASLPEKQLIFFKGDTHTTF